MYHCNLNQANIKLLRINAAKFFVPMLIISNDPFQLKCHKIFSMTQVQALSTHHAVQTAIRKTANIIQVPS